MHHLLTTARLREQLDAIDIEGWDGPTATRLLQVVRERVAVPQTRRHRIAGGSAAQAEATAWEEAWLTLRRPSIRAAANPSGVLWTAAGCSVAGEISARQFACGTRNSWHSLAQARARQGTHRPAAGITRIAEDWEPVGDFAGRPPTSDIGPRLGLIVSAMVDHGWQRHLARDLVSYLAVGVRVRAATGKPVLPWRAAAVRFGLPLRQTMGVARLLIGDHTWPGLLALIVKDGPSAADNPKAIAAIRSTIHRQDHNHHGSGERRARRAASHGGGVRAASKAAAPSGYPNCTTTKSA